MKQVEISLGELAFQAEAGDPCAQYRIAVLFLLGESVEQDLNAAYLWMGRAASGQHHDAQLLVETLAPCCALPKSSKNAGRLPILAGRATRVLATATVPNLRKVQSAVQWIVVGLRETLARKPGTKMPSRHGGEVIDFPAHRIDGFEFPEAL
jgi:hypothetical protein